MSKLVVTGANGFVGRHLLKELVNNKYDIVAVGGTQVESLDNMAGVEYMTLDLLKPEDVNKINFAGVTGIIHLAGLAAVGPSFDSPLKYMEVNVGLEVNLLEAALSQNYKPRFLAISSGALYDSKADQPLTEESPVLSNSPYAVSKIGQEQMANYYGTRGFETIIARPFNHIGPGQGPGFIVPDLAKQIIELEKGEISEISVGNLDAQRDYTDVRDIVKAYRLLIEKGKSGETYNICSGQPRSGKEVLDELCQQAGIQPTVKQDPHKMRPSDSPLIYGNHDKLTADTGWQPNIPLETTLSDVLTSLKAPNT